jgi:type IV secretory pathway component VirB8
MKNFTNKSEAPKKASVADVIELACVAGVCFVALRVVSRVVIAAVTPPTQTVYYVVQPQQQTPAA